MVVLFMAHCLHAKCHSAALMDLSEQQQADVSIWF